MHKGLLLQPSEPQRTQLGLLTDRFLCQQTLFPFRAPAVTTRATIFSHHAMTGNHQWYRISSTGTSNSAGGFGLPYSPRHLAIRTSVAIGDSLQFFPNAPLKCCSLDIQW